MPKVQFNIRGVGIKKKEEEEEGFLRLGHKTLAVKWFQLLSDY